MSNRFANQSPLQSRRSESAPLGASFWAALLTGLVALGQAITTVGGTELLATQLVSPGLWAWGMQAMEIPIVRSGSTDAITNIGFLRSLAIAALAYAAFVTLCLTMGFVQRLWAAPRPASPRGWQVDLRRAVLAAAAGSVALACWEIVWLVLLVFGQQTAANLWISLLPFWTGLCLAVSLVNLSPGEATANTSASTWCWPATWQWAAGVYVLVFVAMNWGLYFNLRVPHGDSVMYEEHLWNVLTGKGFRSDLDPGLFLGEHIQVIHLALLPVYVLWPSHLLLELCESLALAAGAWPVYWMALRHTRSQRAAGTLAVAYLLYFPMQFLDIAIDLKTFRPEAFGIPLLLLLLDQVDRRNVWGALLLVLPVLAVKEDYTIVLAPLGVWMALAFAFDRAPNEDALRAATEALPLWRRLTSWPAVVGLGLAAFATVYLLVATKFVIPYFRGGEEVHYTSYYQQFGRSFTEILITVLTRPDKVFLALANEKTCLYAAAILVPIGGVALGSPARLLVGAPLFVALSLNEMARDPRHHFHAPLVAIVFWAAAAALPRVSQWLCRWPWKSFRPADVASAQVSVACWAASSAFATGLFFSLSPLGISFWDPFSSWSWDKLYQPGERAMQFTKVREAIPNTARVASTDFVHPRFTHCERSYDYSKYLRKVNNFQPGVPADTDYIVIDTRHPYSTLRTFAETREFKEERDQWEELHLDTEGYYIVLKRRR